MSPSIQEVLAKVAGEQTEAAPSFDEMPDQFGARVEPLQPGTYRFKLPDKFEEGGNSVFTPLEDVEIHFRDANNNEQTRKGKRIMANFRDDFPLTIVQSPNDARNGEAFGWMITNVERWRDRQHTQKASDMDYLLRAFAVPAERRPPFGANDQYIQLLLEFGAGKEFTADVTISWYSNPKRQIYAEFTDPAGGRIVQEIPGVYGNGQRYTMSTVPKDETGNYPTTIPVPIIATDPGTGQQVTYTSLVRGFNDLTQYRA